MLLHKKHYYFLIILLLFFSITAGLFSVTLLFSERQSQTQEENDESISYGIIESINHEAGFLIFVIPSLYEINSLVKYKIYFDNNTQVQKKNVFQKNNIFYSANDSIESNVANLKKGDRVFLRFLVVPDTRKLRAVYISHGNPFPEL